MGGTASTTGQATEHEDFTTPPIRRPAPTGHEIHELLGSRWSPRAMDPDRPVPRQKLLRLLEAGRWAPSSSNEQPWRYLVFDERVPEDRERARDVLNPGNAWAKAAPLLLLSVVQTVWMRAKGKEGPNRVALHDVGAASLSIVLQAVHEGLVAHQIGGFKVDEAREVFRLPLDCNPVAMMAIGYPGIVADLPEKDLVREGRPRRREPLEENFFLGRWGNGID